MQEETEKRDYLIYELITDSSRLEWERAKDLDGKAIGIIMSGVIVTLQAGLGGSILKEVPRTCELYIPLFALFLSGIIFLICSIFCGFNAYYARRREVALNTDYLIEKYAKTDRSRADLLREVSKIFSEIVRVNKKINFKKAKSIKNGFLFLVLGVCFIISAVSSLLLM